MKMNWDYWTIILIIEKLRDVANYTLLYTFYSGTFKITKRNEIMQFYSIYTLICILVYPKTLVFAVQPNLTSSSVFHLTIGNRRCFTKTAIHITYTYTLLNTAWTVSAHIIWKYIRWIELTTHIVDVHIHTHICNFYFENMYIHNWSHILL